ncbi:uncharacterized protein BT62DRAFT_1012022 [Guyanagaster necrorhizus]|uniref:Uncharacterized protein n=1 Tax=Guyanagaster necrorhizus TaxID=856835 RepID=A0A9P7VI59_9AGAR|nr:uncharacterized protein BT62DRAFT_1012022 [Guyanagaster necrorhizus MCA 3950]KAG7440995.1 hypothetical protein BT62DRAFT_1012022 [Guyanagaster necrorhizus MCA 3950]
MHDQRRRINNTIYGFMPHMNILIALLVTLLLRGIRKLENKSSISYDIGICGTRPGTIAALTQRRGSWGMMMLAGMDAGDAQLVEAES